MALVHAIFLVASTAHAGTCERATTVADVEVAVVQARAAYASEDHIALAAAVVDGRTALECVVEPVRPDLSEALHLAMGLWVAVEQGDASAVPYLAAGRVRREPGALGLTLTDAEGALVDRVAPALDAWSVTSGGLVAPPLRGHVVLDGDDNERRLPEQVPFVMQRMVGENVIATDYVTPEMKPPNYPHRRPILAISSSVLAVASGGLFLGAGLTQAEVFAPHDREQTVDELAALKSRNHGMFIAGSATGALAVLGVSQLVFSYRW